MINKCIQQQLSQSVADPCFGPRGCKQEIYLVSEIVRFVRDNGAIYPGGASAECTNDGQNKTISGLSSTRSWRPQLKVVNKLQMQIRPVQLQGTGWLNTGAYGVKREA